MITIQEIKDLRKYLVEEYHGARVTQQKKMQEYYDDTFAVPQIKEPMYISRTGTGAWLVDGPSSHIITTNPQVFVSPKRQTKECQESADKVNSLLNHWVSLIRRQSNQPFREFNKNLFLRGEAWIHPVHKEGWEEGNQLPIEFLTPDPLIVFGSPNEQNGIPEFACLIYQVSSYMIRRLYPEFSYDVNKKNVEWFEFWDSKSKYFEVDSKPLYDGILENILGRVPFIHAYSGFGKESPEGKPETLTIGRLDRVTDLLHQLCIMNSNLDSTFTKFARPRYQLYLPPGIGMSDTERNKWREAIDMSAGSLSIFPNGANLEEGTRLLPSAEAFQHYANLQVRVAMEAPPIMAGLPSGSSGRHEDIVSYNFVRRFDCVVENAELSWGKALDTSLDTIKKVPGYCPLTQWLDIPEGGKKEITIDEEDIDNSSQCVLKLKAADPIEDDRKLMAGRALVESGRIDWETFLVEYAGYTPDKARLIKTKTIAEKIVTTSPLMQELIARKALENLGMTEELQTLEAERQLQENMSGALKQKAQQGALTGPRGGEPRSFNQQSPAALDMADMMLSQGGIRQPPAEVV